jgi:prepilin-type N-terminal cleavage/methylation domain-containing protein
MQESRTNEGFTILEVMVALVILSVGMLGVGTMLTTSLTLDRRSTQDRNAQYVAIDKIEYLRKLPRNITALGSTVTSHPELVAQLENYHEYTDYGYSSLGYSTFTTDHPEEVETILDPDMSKRQLYARRWTVSRLFWNDPLNGGEVDSGVLQVDIWVGWPYKGAAGNCQPNDPTKCDRFIEMTTFFRPLPPP